MPSRVRCYLFSRAGGGAHPLEQALDGADGESRPAPGDEEGGFAALRDGAALFDPTLNEREGAWLDREVVHGAALSANGNKGRAGSVHLVNVEADELVNAEADGEEEREYGAVSRPEHWRGDLVERAEQPVDLRDRQHRGVARRLAEEWDAVGWVGGPDAGLNSAPRESANSCKDLVPRLRGWPRAVAERVGQEAFDGAAVWRALTNEQKKAAGDFRVGVTRSSGARGLKVIDERALELAHRAEA